MNLKIGENISWEEIDDELVIFKLDTGNYYRLNKTGGLIFSRVSSGTTMSLVLEELMQIYDLGKDAVANDADSFIQSMISEGLLVING